MCIAKPPYEDAHGSVDARPSTSKVRTPSIEAAVQLGQYQQNWLTYRATREALRREDFLHSAKARPYSDQANPDDVYVARADAIMSGESSTWLASHEQPVKSPRV